MCFAVKKLPWLKLHELLIVALVVYSCKTWAPLAIRYSFVFSFDNAGIESERVASRPTDETFNQCFVYERTKFTRSLKAMSIY